MTKMIRIIGKCKKCNTPLSTINIIEEGGVSYFDSDNHLSGMSSGFNKVLCPKCFDVSNSNITINKYKNRTEYLTPQDVKENDEALKEHMRFFR